MNRSNQSGIAIIPLLMASGMVVIIALVISFFLTSQTKTSVKISNSAQCQVLTKSVNEFILKDEGTLFINSFGPSANSSNFPNNVGTTQDGFFRMNSTIPVIVATGAPILTNAPYNARVAVPNDWALNNSLNINNSMNRLVALTNPKQLCCESLNLNDSNCGNLIYSSTDLPNSIRGLNLENDSINVRIGINFRDTKNGVLCNGRVLNPTRLPVSANSAWAEYAFRVTLNPTLPNEEICEGRGRVSFATDDISPIPLLEYDTANLCGHGINTGVICTDNPSAAETVTLRVKTVNNTASCKAQCLDRLQVPNCGTPGPQALSDALCNQNCQEIDPGSIYFCRIGERNWFLNNPNYWEPCHVAQVHDFDGSDAGDVSIRYTPRFPDGSRTETTTLATISLTNLKSDRSYQVDVRAVDTKGRFMGPSFCSQSNSCLLDDTTLAPAFVVSQSAPELVSLVETTNVVDPARGGMGAGAFTDEYQCNAGISTWAANTRYNLPPGVYRDFNLDSSCSSDIRNGNPPITNCQFPDSACVGVASCSCNGQCVVNAEVRGGNDAARITLDVSITNACGKMSNDRREDWCYDSIVDFDVSVIDDVGQYIGSVAHPSINHRITNPGAKSTCGVAFNVPDMGGGSQWVRNPGIRLIDGWNLATDSGCSPIIGGNQYCTQTRDACGRTENTAGTYYTSGLPLAPTTNRCSSVGASPVEGFACIANLYCDRNYQCHSTNTCQNFGRNCNNNGLPSGNPSAPCANPTDCAGQHGSCSTTYTCRAAGGVEEDQNCTLGNPCTIRPVCNNRDCSCGTAANPQANGACSLGSMCASGTPFFGGVCLVDSRPTSIACTYGSPRGNCANIQGVCRIKTQGTCSCPTEQTCPGGGAVRNCPTLSTCI